MDAIRTNYHVSCEVSATLCDYCGTQLALLDSGNSLRRKNFRLILDFVVQDLDQHLAVKENDWICVSALATYYQLLHAF
jgi:hypothetical protein